MSAGRESNAATKRLGGLLRKYNRPGPRYTSYPTAPAWNDTFGPAEMEGRLARLDAQSRAGEARPLSLYVHIPFCHNRCLYCGCNVVISPKDRLSPRYLQGLEREVGLMRRLLRSPGPVHQLHLGGGTPTYLTPRQLEQLQKIFTDQFSLAPDAEVSIEVDPGVTTREHLETLRRLGFNRISMGVQDLDPKVQQAVRRIQPEEQTGRFYESCRQSGFDSINMDLIYGLPYQTARSFRKTVDRVIDWAPDRIAVFNYAHVPWIKPHQRQMPEEALPGPDVKFTIFLETRERFLDAGFAAIGMDHFALPTDELAQARRREVLRRNFMGYTTKPATDILAFGVSSISEVAGAYAQNRTKLIDYLRAVEDGGLATQRGAQLSPDDRIRRAVIMDLMCNFAVIKSRIESAHQLSFDDYFSSELNRLKEQEGDGLVRLSPKRIELTDLGQLLVRNVAMVFDAYLVDSPTAGRPLYSQTV